MKKHLLRKILLNVVLGGVLLSVLSVGTLAEAEFKYKVDDGAEQTWDGSANLYGIGNKLEVWSSNGLDSTNKNIYGGVDRVSVYNKLVIFKGGSVEDVYGASVNDGTIAFAPTEVIGNEVNITGGVVRHVYGGYGRNANASVHIVTGNIVSISGGQVNGEVCGGYAIFGETSGNKVIISGGDLAHAKVYGYGGSPSSHSNNTLQIENSVTIKEIHNFENISFVLPTITGDKTLLSLTNAFSVTSEKVSANLGDNTNSTLNSHNVTLANNVSGNFDVTYYDKNNNATGYVEKFNLVSAGAMKIGEGAEMHLVSDLTTDAGELLGKQNKLYVDNGKNLTFESGTLTKNITGTGTTEFNNTVNVADGVQLDMATNNVNGTLDVAGNITAGNINFKNDSTLKVDGRKITSTAAIRNITSATVESGAKLYVSNAVKETPYKILAGSGISVSGWQTDAEMGDGFRAAYGLLVDTDNITNNGNEFTIRFIEDPMTLDNVDIPNVFTNMPIDSKLQNFVDTISQTNPYKSTQATIINTMSNLNSLANVQRSTYTVSNMAADSIHHNIDVFQRPILVGHKAQGIGHKAEGVREREEGLRNVFANDKDTAEIKTVEQGESGNIMPAKATTERQTYNKEVWANYIHSKRTIDGMKTGKFLQQDSTSQYNGITTGIDLWNSRHGFGGIALTTVDGEINSNQKASSIKNETDYKGISVYNRYDTKNTAILTDFTYTHSDHDIKMRTAGTEDITAKPKVDAYSIGIRAEQPIAVSKTSEIAPYAGVRYTKISSKDYKTSLDLQYDIDSQKIFNIPIGIAWRNKNQTAGGWEIGEVIETGYIWNLGDRNSTQHLSYGGINDNIGFAMADKGEYFARMAIQAIHKDTDFEVGYKYTKGDTVKDSQWNFNVNHSFGNANGMPYKSVLLGKIDLLEAANKDLRAELAEKDAEIAKLKQLLASE